MNRNSLSLALRVCLVIPLAGVAQAQRPEKRVQPRPQTTSPPATPAPTPAPHTAATWDVDKVVKHLQENARSKSGGLCAKYTRQAIEAGAGGAEMKRTRHAKDYGPSLIQFGFREYSSKQIAPNDFRKGDIVVIQNAKGHSSGHMAMYDGKQWISDFEQRDHWGGSIRNASPSYKVYRFDTKTSGHPTTGAARPANGSGLGGVLINPTPKREDSGVDDRAASRILDDRPAAKAQSWRIALPRKGADDDNESD